MSVKCLIQVYIYMKWDYKASLRNMAYKKSHVKFSQTSACINHIYLAEGLPNDKLITYPIPLRILSSFLSPNSHDLFASAQVI